MHNLLRLLGQAQYHVKILAAVAFASKQAGFVQQGLLKHSKMTNVIVRPQIINSKIRLKMSNRDIFCRTLKSQLVCINKIRSLLADRFHIFIKHRGVQQIVVVKQGDIISCGHFNTGIGVAGYAKIFL